MLYFVVYKYGIGRMFSCFFVLTTSTVYEKYIIFALFRCIFSFLVVDHCVCVCVCVCACACVCVHSTCILNSQTCTQKHTFVLYRFTL